MTVTVTRNPTSDEAVAGTWTGTAGSRWSVVDDHPDVAGTDSLTHGTTTAGTLTFGFSAFSIPLTATNIQVFVDYYDIKTATQQSFFGARLKVGASYFNATTHNPAQTRTLRTDAWATNPATSAAWTPQQINGTSASNNLTAFGYSSTDANPSILTSSIQLRVTYENNYTLVAAAGAIALTGVNAALRAALPVSVVAFALTGSDVTMTAGGVDVVLPAAAGVFSLTGNAAGLRSQRALSAGAGSFALTGSVAGLKVAMPAGVGAFALSGLAAGLRAQRRVVANTRAFALAGTTTALRVTMPASVGAFTLSGVAATLRAQRLLSAAVGDFTLTGIAVSLSRTQRLVVTPGVFALTGNGATLVYVGLQSYSLQAATAVFSLAGSSAALTAQRRLFAAPGAFSMTGSAAGLAVLLPAGVGVLSLSGGVASLRADRRIDTETGEFSLDGSDVALETSRRLGADVGDFALLGGAGILRRGYSVAAAQAVYGLTGSSVDFDWTRRMVADPGAFLLIGRAAILTLSVSGYAALTLLPVVPTTRMVVRSERATKLTTRLLTMALHVGDTSEVEVEITPRATGLLGDPSALSIRVTPPPDPVTGEARSALTYTYGEDTNVVKVSTGKYRALIDCTYVGRWHFTWLSPGPTAKGAEPGYFDVDDVT